MFSANSEELIQNKLLYIIDKSPSNLTKYELIEFLLEKNYIDFFSIQQYLSELIDSDFIEIINNDNKEQYKVLEKGNTALDCFISKIPDNIKKDLEVEFNSQKIQKKKETQVISEYFQREDGQFIVNLRLVENSDTLFSLYLNVATKEQAELISDSWKEKTDLIYSETIRLLIE